MKKILWITFLILFLSSADAFATLPVYQSFNEGKCEEATSVVVNKPSGVVEGDLMIAFCSTDGYTETHTAPSASWNKIIKDVANGGSTFSIWYKIADASEPSTYTFSNDSNEEFYAWIIRITGHSATSPIHKISFLDSGGDNSSQARCPVLTTDHDDCLIIRAFSADDGDISVDSGWESATNITVDKSSTSAGECSGGCAWENKATAGLISTEDCTFTSAEQWTAITIAIRSSSAGWVTPTGFVDSGDNWTNEQKVYDGSITTSSNNSLAAGSWSSYLELTVPEVTNCTKMRFYAHYNASSINSISIDLYYNSQWNNIYEGAYTSMTWVEKAIGSTQAVTSMRVKFYNTSGTNYNVSFYEAHFWDDGPPESALSIKWNTKTLVYFDTKSVNKWNTFD